MRVTLRQLAQRGGVSPATASLALRDDPRVAAATGERIRRLARELGYVPSNLGRALQARRSRLLGYLLSSATASFYSEIIQGIGEAAGRAGYGVLTALRTPATEGNIDHVSSFREKNVDGVLVSSYDAETARRLSALEDAGVPVVVCSGESFDPRTPAVVIDNLAGGRLAAEHLVGLGHRRLAYCFKSHGQPRRLEGAARAARAAGIPEPEVCADAAALGALLESPERPTGIVAASDFAAVEVKHAVEAAGLSIPGDVSVVGFDDMWFAALPEFDFTTAAQPKADIGRLSVEMLLARIGGKKVKSRKLQPELVVRGSTSPP
jgi:DNA-binding LacI/PurR family transcriptional regulator